MRQSLKKHMHALNELKKQPATAETLSAFWKQMQKADTNLLFLTTVYQPIKSKKFS